VNLVVQGVYAHLIDRGVGIPTLFLHGNPDIGALWSEVIAHLEGRYRCLAPDLPGYGLSVAPPDFDLSLENMARFVDRLIEAVGVAERLNLVAHDFGGHYGLAWAITHPDKVRRIAILNTSFFSDYQWHVAARLLRAPVIGDLITALMTPAMMAREMRRVSPRLTPAGSRYVDSIALPPATKRMMLRLYRASDPRRFVGWETRLTALTASVPTWVLWGDLDPFADRAYADRFGAQRVVRFPDCGHWLPLEDPAGIAARLGELFA
jgi:pimeloyl-ACP methyl ester carboxylesterase